MYRERVKKRKNGKDYGENEIKNLKIKDL